MVGVLAMAAAGAAHPPVKNYEIEPCKKRRREDEESSCKTVAKYLSPQGKSGDRVFSPPKSTNILDYFRKASPINEKSQFPKGCKMKSPAPLSVHSGKDCTSPWKMPPSTEVKKRGKRVNLSHQLNNIPTGNESPIEISSDESKEEASLKSDFVEDSTSLLLHQKRGEALAESIQDVKSRWSAITSAPSSKKVNPKRGHTKNDFKRSRKRKHKDIIDLSESLPLAEELSLKKDGQGSKQAIASLPVEPESAASGASPGAQGACFNDSTVTVSYEEFLKSHKEDKVYQLADATMAVCLPSETMGDIGRRGYISDTDTCEGPQQAHFKTVTVLAQVHPAPPKKTGKIPTMFLKQKQVELENSFSDPESEQTPQKRKSNVVIQEADLELAVLDPGSSEAVKPKCSLEERQQFMKAFRQPACDALKTGVKKTSDKKDLHETSSHEEASSNSSRNIMENPTTEVSNNSESQSYTDKGSFPKENKKLKQQGKRTETGVMLSENRDRNTQKKEITSFLQDKQDQNRLRMSLRQKRTEGFKGRALFSSKSLVCENTAKDDPLTISSPNYNKSSRKTSPPAKEVKVTHSKSEPEDNLVNASTPKSARRSVRRSSPPTTVDIRGSDSEDAQDYTPIKASTPKAASLPGKHNLYTAELILISSDSESPIRMKFTRISTPKKSKRKYKKRSQKSEATDGDLTLQTRKASRASKNISKAKRLIEKAKALHMSKSKATDETATPLRRSSRHQALTERKKLSEMEDSVIRIDSSPTSLKQSEKNQKKLKCLNDVLGKNLSQLPKKVPGKVKVAPLFLARKAKKIADPVFEFDDSSQDTSEKAQNCDVQLKAKRAFLMSGLPDLLKRQIAKKAAALDAYSTASASFQRVVHVQQKDDGCLLWHLTPPSCPLLTKLKELNPRVVDVSKCAIGLGEFSTLNSDLQSNHSAVVLVETRRAFTEEVRNALLEEIRWSNPGFSLKNYFPLLLKKQSEPAALSECLSNQEPDVTQKGPKRKRTETENRKSKRKKPHDYSESPKKLSGPPEELDLRNKSSEIKLDSSKESVVEDTLWTEKYQPQNSSELIGNELAIKKLHSWLKDWKRRTELEERQNLKGKRDEKPEAPSESMEFKGSSDEEESRLCNTVLLTGPPGVGKTASVYACAQELGFKIFEVNASSQRSGRQILSQLKEATQSHQVDKQGVNSQKPCFFNSYNIGKSPKKFSSPKKVVTSPRKIPPSSPKSSGPKRALPLKTLANYFKVSSKQKNDEEIAALQENNKGIKNFDQKPVTQTKITTNSNREFGAEEPNRKNATSLILFEEVDIIFDEDAGFLSAVKALMATTKRPVILTTSDPTFSLMFDGYFEEIKFSTPSTQNVASYLQMICLTENFRTDVKDLITFLTAHTCDIRRSILYLQFWIKSGGGCLEERPLFLYGGNDRNGQPVGSENGADSKKYPNNSKKNPPDLPKCDTGCVETLFGLKNIFHSSEDVFSFLKHKLKTKEEWHKLIQLLTEFQTRSVDFLYSNLEFVLPLPVDAIPETPSLCGLLENVGASPAVDSGKRLAGNHSEGQQPSKKSQKKRRKKKMVTLDDSDLFDNKPDFSHELISLSPASLSSADECKDNENTPETKKLHKCLHSDNDGIYRSPKTPAEKKCSALVSHCLNSLTEFMDNMSFLDALLPDVKGQNELGENDFSWTSGNVKNGLCDALTLESKDGQPSQSSAELKAVVEALSFTECSSAISKAMETSLNSCKKLGRDPTKDLTLYVSKQRTNVYFSQSAADLDAQKRIAVVKSVFSSRSLLNLGNRQAGVIEYLPTLRSICRTEKLKEQGKSKRRFLHYFEGIHLDVSKETMTALAADFP
ncbi:ATPase family AAA domain-containing protein 5 isoform X2 [Tenrec ecaudatus]|uniref:ATPase family AAA domain-containing protein 5 isoform X2 n=1 Tax=Tenrec ecaudatus TaxID=94439 RepID=UPI003F59F350